MKVWVTKYALTEGIFERNGEESKKYPGMFVPLRTCDRYFHKGEWHTTESAALEKAEKMRIAKIASLKKQIAKLEKLKFEPKGE